MMTERDRECHITPDNARERQRETERYREIRRETEIYTHICGEIQRETTRYRERHQTAALGGEVHNGAHIHTYI